MYIKEKDIRSGYLFTTSSGKPTVRSRLNYCFDYIRKIVPSLKDICPDHIRTIGKIFYQEGYSYDYIFETMSDDSSF